MTMYIRIDENGDPEGSGIDRNNMYYIMGMTHVYSEEQVTAAGYAELVDGDPRPPNGESLYDVYPGAIEKQLDGSIKQLWTEIEIDNAEKLNRWVVRKRLGLLMQSDWTQMPDTALSPTIKAEWGVYRQSLRDVPNITDFDLVLKSDDIVWPTIPGMVVNNS